MKDILIPALEKAKDLMCLTTTMVFVLSGVYLWLIDGTDLKTKGMNRELRLTKVVAVIYIFGAIGVFILL